MFLAHVIGIGPHGPTKDGHQALSGVKVAFGAKRHSPWLPPGLLLKPLMPLDQSIKEIKERLSRESVAVLASGDPLFFGIGRRLLKEIEAPRLSFYPAVSSIQLAFAAIKEPWDKAHFISLHGRSHELLRELAPLPRTKVAVLTSSGKDPFRMAQRLCSAGLEDLKLWVLEDLGTSSQRITEARARSLPPGPYSDLNLVIVDWSPLPRPRLGLRTEEFSYQRGLITKDEVRAIILAKLRLPAQGILWDIGAGSGSVAIEALGISPQLRVYAIEKDPLQIKYLQENIRRYQAFQIEALFENAETAIKRLPSPDRVFIGGSGGKLREIIQTTLARLNPGGRIVISAVTLDTLSQADEILRGEGLRPEIISVQINRTDSGTKPRIFRAENVIFIISCEKTYETPTSGLS